MSSIRGSTTTRRSTAAGACTPTGTTGVWNAASGRSAGWEQWSIDLGAYAGKQVEISIAYASDWSVQGLGAFVDDVTLSTGETTSFETEPRRLGCDRPAARQRAELEQLDADDRGGLPRGRGRGDAGHPLHGLRHRGHRDAAPRGTTVMRRSLDYLLR